MRISNWYNNRDIRLEEVPQPVPDRDEMLVRVMACGICGSDIVEWYRLPRAPLVQGHEIGAEVVQVGEAVSRYRPGDRVFIAPKVPCMTCSYCRNGHFPVCETVKDRLPGGFAELILVPKALVQNGTYPLPAGISYDQSTFIEPLACVVRAQNLAGLKQGQSVLIMGCGMSGLLHVKLAKTKGCRVIATDISRPRRTLARDFGADVTIDALEDVPGRLAADPEGMADVVMVCTSAVSAIEQAWRSVDKGGAVVFFAVPGPDEQIQVPINGFWTRETRILTSYYCGPPDILKAIELLESGVLGVDELVTHRLPLADIAEGFRLVMDGTESVKVIIHPNA